MTARPPQLLDVDQAAELLAVRPRMIRRLIEERRLPVVRVGRHVRVDAADLAAYVEAQRRPGVPLTVERQQPHGRPGPLRRLPLDRTG